MYEFCFWVLFGVSTLLVVIETARSTNNSDSANEELLWNLREFFGMIIMTVIVILLSFLASENGLSTDRANVLVALSLFLMPLRKIADWAIWSVNLHRLNNGTPLISSLDSFIVIDKKTGQKTYVPRIVMAYHILVFIIFIVLSLIISLIPGLLMTRVQIVINTWTNIAEKATGNIGDRIILVIWLVTLIVLIGLLVNLLRKVIRRWTSEEGEVSGMLVTAFVSMIVFILRKIFIYVFIMDKYIFQDIIFWIVIIGLIVLFGSIMFRNIPDD